MPRKVRPDWPFDVIEDDCLFSRSTLSADPDAMDYVVVTDTWLARVDAARAKDREMRVQVMTTDGARIIANQRLDLACTRFSDHLLLETGKDRGNTRYKQFFGGPVSSFVRMALTRQVERVRAWLTQSSDAVLERFKPELTTWSGKAQEALDKTAATALIRGEARLARERLAEELTAERDALRDALAARARERGLPREWPDYFFRVENRGSGTEDGDTPAPTGDTPAG